MSKLSGLKKETKELIDLINDYKNGSTSYGRQPFDNNHWFERMFRLYIDGSYSYPGNEPGYKFVERLRNQVQEILALKPESAYKKLRSLVISLFMDLIRVEYPELSRSTIQKTFVKNMTTKEIELLNHHLVDDITEMYGSAENLGLKDHSNSPGKNIPGREHSTYVLDELKKAEKDHDWNYPISMKIKGIENESKWFTLNKSEFEDLKRFVHNQIVR